MIKSSIFFDSFLFRIMYVMLTYSSKIKIIGKRSNKKVNYLMNSLLIRINHC